MTGAGIRPTGAGGLRRSSPQACAGGRRHGGPGGRCCGGRSREGGRRRQQEGRCRLVAPRPAAGTMTGAGLRPTGAGGQSRTEAVVACRRPAPRPAPEVGAAAAARGKAGAAIGGRRRPQEGRCWLPHHESTTGGQRHDRARPAPLEGRPQRWPRSALVQPPTMTRESCCDLNLHNRESSRGRDMSQAVPCARRGAVSTSTAPA